MSKSKVYCSVYGCKSMYKRATDISFHYFPKDANSNGRKVMITNKYGEQERVGIQLAWTLVLKMGKKVTPSMRVCSFHFSEDDFIYPGMPVRRRILKPNAVPSQNLPVLPQRSSQLSPTKVTNSAAKRRDRAINRKSLKASPLKIVSTEDEEAAVALLELAECHPYLNVLPEEPPLGSPSGLGISGKSDKCLQVSSGDLMNKFVNIIDNDKKLSLFTGLPNFDILHWLVEEVSLVTEDKRIHKLSVYERVVLTLMKLKQNLSFSMLSSLFGHITATTCKTIFKDTVIVLSEILKAVVPWPKKEEILNRMPKCFQSFKSVRIVLDCTEISVQKCKCLVCRIKLYSHYKSGLTVKFMTGVTPAGLISYVSTAYGGKASDKTIFDQSGLIDRMEVGDAIMVDKGFLIDSTCAQHKITLIRPPFLRGKERFSREEALLNREIASARVHIERSNQRIKMFKIFASKYEMCLFDIVNECFLAVCGLTNLCSPILGDDKF